MTAVQEKEGKNQSSNETIKWLSKTLGNVTLQITLNQLLIFKIKSFHTLVITHLSKRYQVTPLNFSKKKDLPKQLHKMLFRDTHEPFEMD